MVGVKKGFIRSVETVIAIILFLSFYNLATAAFSVQRQRASPEIAVSAMLDSLKRAGILENMLKNYELNELSTYAYYLLPPSIGYKIEASYSEPVIIKNNLNTVNSANISFLKSFPNLANTGSVAVYDMHNNYLETSAVCNYYEIRISVQASAELNNETITLQNVRFVTSASEKINETSIEAYVGPLRALAELGAFNYDSEYYNATADVTILVSRAEAGELLDISLLYAANDSYKINTYPPLNTGTIMPYESLAPQRAKTCEIISQISLQPNEEQVLLLTYELNTDTNKTYKTLIRDYENIDIISNDDYYRGTMPYYNYEALNSESVSKTIMTNTKNIVLTMKVWYYE